MADDLVAGGCPAYSPFFGFSGITFALVFSVIYLLIIITIILNFNINV